ncbi:MULTISPECIES: type II toxin-antitoxin system VapC family toxin [unclassified Archaeoglobus]|jgi:predicted nucleic acid-binding protein|uniref:type II toxin-antitoxin system VapC family toxin n=1 Tax=unclassified Archaeoglobus TaxID=2643606 RepID=UPI0025C5A67B|nr:MULTISPECIES: type II toxin-antitoxin system VapC family toxin [unclassified Archaeoglobus]
MPDKVVLDSSVIAAVFFREDDVASKAEKILEEFEILYTLDLAIAEITNIAWKKAVFEEEPADIVEEGLSACIEFVTFVCQIVTSAELYDLAFKIAVEKRITAYDALFVAASERCDAPLATADRELARKIDNVILVR